ncbi:MAG: sensor domain-containing diguanylate cyclase [Bdellovibrionota bacterium]
MRNLSLSTRLFLSCFLVSALLFCGIYFYVKGFNERREFQQAISSFDSAQSRLEGMLRARHQTLAELSKDLVAHQTASLARAEFEATGMTFVLVQNGQAVASGVPLVESDQQVFRRRAFGHRAPHVELTSGHYLTRTLEPGGGAELILLYPLAELERASRELLEAFLVAGLALLLLTGVLSQILAREISRPLSSLRNRVREVAESIGLDPPAAKGDEMREIAAAYIDFAQAMHTALEHKKLAMEELEAYKGELLRVNSNLHRRLFQVKVLLSLWSERDKALDVKDFLSRFLEALMPGLPFEYGCVIIRPIADMGTETIFAKKLAAPAAKDLDESGSAGTLWTDIIDPQVKEFLLKESESCMKTHSVRLNSVLGCMRAGSPPAPVTVLSFRLKQGEEPLGSVHFLTEFASPQISVGLNEFLLSLSAQVSAQLQIQALSFATRLDPLTRLYNRGYLNDRLREEVVRSARKKDRFSLVLLDIDHFKKVNEVHGQQAADEVLRGVASLLKATCRGSDAVCRFDGPVLAIVLADTPLAGAKIFAENVRRAVSDRDFHIPGGSLHITASLGISEYPSSGSGVEALVSQAEHALLDAKEGGRNAWRSAA